MTPPILDPRDGDIEDDASSPKQRTLLSLAGSLLAEISLPKLAAVWLLLIGLPAVLLGAAPLLVSLWVAAVLSHAANLFTEIGPVLLLPPIAALGWFGGRKLLRLAESSFWSLNALAVQPIYIVLREGLRHLAEATLIGAGGEARRAGLRAGTAAASGLAMAALGAGLIALTLPATRWTGTLADFTAPLHLLPVLLANSVVMIFGYVAAAAMIWGIADATMAQPADLPGFAAPSADARCWRVAHLSDLHTVGEEYGFRIESGRAGPRGNERLRRTLARLDEVHAADPLDLVLLTGDMTDAGRSAEWAEFLDALGAYPHLAAIALALPGNHDVNVVDRANPARMELPTSPAKRLRQLRTVSAMAALQGERVKVATPGGLGDTLAATLAPHAADIAGFADTGAHRLSRALAGLWPGVFPQILPPDTPNGLGVIVLNSNAETHFSFTNALGLVANDQTRALAAAARHYPRACWIVALHHHVVEYPRRAKALSERIGTALVNGTWFIRQLRPLAGRAVLMHGHRHVDWVGTCGGLLVVSAPSPVMAAASPYFYIHTVAIGSDGRIRLRPPERIDLARPPRHPASVSRERDIAAPTAGGD